MAEAVFLKISEMTLAIDTVSEANCSEHWRKKHARHKLQKLMIKMNDHRIPKTLPIHIKFTRIATRKLDAHDNLRISLKWICDQVCAQITGNYVPGRADDDSRITFEYDQVGGSPKMVKIEFFQIQPT